MARLLITLLLVGCAAPTYPPAPYGYDLHAVIPDLTFDGETGPIRLRSFYEPSASTSHLLVLRVGAGWCGTCRWHLGHTQEMVDVDPTVQIVDLAVADDDNVPATTAFLSAYRARMDLVQTLAVDPAFQLRPSLIVDGPLPFLVVIDRRTMQIRDTLNNPDPDALALSLRTQLKKLNGTALTPTLSTDGADGFHRNEWDLLRDMRLPTAPPPDPTNAKADDAAAASLGRTLFSDAQLSPSGTVSCASCHDPTGSFADGKPQAVGVATGDRNAPSILFAAHARWQFWDGRADSLWAQALGPIENPKEIGSSRLFVAHALFDHHRAEYEAVFSSLPDLTDTTRFPPAGKPGDPAFDALTVDDKRAVSTVFANAGKAIAAYERTLRAKPNLLDAYVAGDGNALSDAQKQSLHTYFLIGCAQCHYGPRLTDDAFHVLRFPTGRRDGQPDRGRADGIAALLASEFTASGPFSDGTGPSYAALVASPNTLGAFKTPPIRGVANTAPYGHGGTLPTLLDVSKAYGTAGLAPTDPAAVGDSEPWLALFLGGHAPELVPFLDILTATPVP